MTDALLPPPEGTVERWAFDYVTSRELSRKLAPPAPPAEWMPAPLEYHVTAPGRPPELVQRETRWKTPRPGALREPARRAEVLHTFLHHELQAAELMCWAILRFPRAPDAFRRGVLAICRDELRHMHMYAEHLERLGHPFGSEPINDWFWERVPSATTPQHFVAGLGIGFEGGNLDHGLRFAERFTSAGDTRAARIQEIIVEEEIPHVAFALHWFRQLTGDVDFAVWREHLPKPLSPMMTRGTPLNLDARRRAGYSEEFLENLSEWGRESLTRAPRAPSP
ncbi:ferritin-like domain-containing protein [Myxococcota bacterium]|nr:ferritin-like domain-containing protein [Myxococcota bacterium]